MAVHRLQNGHGEQLLKGGKHHHIGEVVQLVHLVPVDEAQQLEVLRRVLQDLLDLVMSLGDEAEGKTSRPEKGDIRHPPGQLDIVKEALAFLKLSGTEDDEGVLLHPIFCPKRRLFLPGKRIKFFIRYKVGDVGDLSGVHPIPGQFPDKVGVDRHQIIHALIKPDDISIEHLPYMVGEFEAVFQRLRQKMDISHRYAATPGEVPQQIKFGIDGVIVHDVTDGIFVLITDELVGQIGLDQIHLLDVGGKHSLPLDAVGMGEHIDGMHRLHSLVSL